MVTASIAIVRLIGQEASEIDDAALQRLILAMGAFGDAIVATDTLGNTRLINPPAEVFLERTNDDLAGMPIESVLPIINAATEGAAIHPIRRVLEAHEPATSAEPMLLVLGSNRISISETTAGSNPEIPIGSGMGGSLCGALAIIRTNTTQGTAELTPHESQRQIEEERQTDRMRVLAGGIAHDLNNLLTVIAGNVELARFDIRDTNVAVECLEQIAAASRRAANLTQQLLTYAGRTRVVMIPMDLNTLIGGVAQQFADTTGGRVVVQMELSENLPQVAADSSHLQQALMNILTNAVEAISEVSGTITITTEKRVMSSADLAPLTLGSNLSPGIYVALSITDSGNGMDAVTRTRIFEPFFTTKFIGRGLGLATVLGIVKEHRGCLDVVSAVDRGTTLKILLPALPVVDEMHPQPHEETTLQSAVLGRVLVVDDEESVRTVTARMLRRLSYNVELAADGTAAVELFRANHEQLTGVLLDLTMPGMSGAAVVHALTEIDAHIPLIIMSGYNKGDAAAQLGPERVLHFLAKPFTFDALREAVQQAFA